MGRAFGWLAALGLALGAAGGAGAATLSPVLEPPLSIAAVPSASAPPPASFQLSGSDGSTWDQPPEPATVMLIATGLAGLVVLGHNEFA